MLYFIPFHLDIMHDTRTFFYTKIHVFAENYAIEETPNE